MTLTFPVAEGGRDPDVGKCPIATWPNKSKSGDVILLDVNISAINPVLRLGRKLMFITSKISVHYHTMILGRWKNVKDSQFLWESWSFFYAGSIHHLHGCKGFEWDSYGFIDCCKWSFTYFFWGNVERLQQQHGSWPRDLTSSEHVNPHSQKIITWVVGSTQDRITRSEKQIKRSVHLISIYINNLLHD